MSIDLENEVDTNVFDTPELTVPPSPPDAHRAVITSVTAVTLNNEKQSTKIVVALTSRDVPTIETALDVWVPKGFVQGYGPTFDPKDLDEKSQTSYRIGISNSDKNATLQQVVKAALASGRNAGELGITAAKSFAEYVENLNTLTQGVECIMTRRERGGEPPYNHTMEVKKIFPADASETQPKAFNRFVKAWE